MSVMLVAGLGAFCSMLSSVGNAGVLLPPVKYAVQVVLDTGVIVCDAAPVSLQYENTNSPLVPWGDGASSTCDEFAGHENVCCELYVVPSTTKERPAGDDFTTTVTFAPKAGVSVMGAFIFTLAGLAQPLYEPDPVPVHPLKP